METVVLCPGCGQENPADREYCLACRSALERGALVTEEEARLYWLRRLADLRRRKFVQWSFWGIIAVAVGLYLYLEVINPVRVGPPASTIGVSSEPGDWPMLGRGPTHAGFAGDANLVPEGRVVWRLETEKPFLSSPAVVDGILYASTGDWRVVALDTETGDLIWEHPVTGPVDSSPTVADSFVYVGLRDGRLLALDRSDGSLQWEFDTDEPIYSSPTVHEGILYLGSSSRRMFSLDAVTGEQRWEYRSKGRVTEGAAIHSDVIAFNVQNQRVYILDLATGRHRLDMRTSDTWGAPSIDEDFVYVADSRGVLRAIDWSQRDLPFEKTARFIRAQLFFWGFVNTLPPHKGFTWAYFDRGGRMVGTPALGFDMVYVGSDAGTLHAVDRSNGEGRWRFDAEGDISTSPSISGTTVYVGDENGILYGVDALTGEQVWRFEVDSRIVSTPVLANGMVFVATKGGTLYAIR